MIQVHDLRHVDPDTVGAWADHISLHLRQADLDEIEAMGSGTDALHLSVALSTHGYAVLDREGVPCAMFGAAPHPLLGVGVVWMLGTDKVRTEAYSIARQTRRYFQSLNDAYPILWNYIDARNTVSLRWLRWGGFKLLRDTEIGGYPFHIFARSTHSV